MRCLHCQTLIAFQITFEGTLSKLYIQMCVLIYFEFENRDLISTTALIRSLANKMMVMITREGASPLRFAQVGGLGLASDGALLGCSYCNASGVFFEFSLVHVL